MPAHSKIEMIIERLQESLQLATQTQAPLLTELLRMSILEALNQLETYHDSPSIISENAKA